MKSFKEISEEVSRKPFKTPEAIALAKEKYDLIVQTLSSGKRVQISTAYKSTIYDKRHVGMFKANDHGLWVQRGKNWDCIDYSNIRTEK